MPTVVLRSPHETLGGLVHFPRMLDKIRARAAGTLDHAYFKMLGSGFDARLCAFLGINYTALAEAVVAEALNDDAALRWCQERIEWPGAESRLGFNSFMEKRGWRDDFTPRLFEMREEMGLDDDGSIQTAFRVLDADEGRLADFSAHPFCAPQIAERVKIFQTHARPYAPIATGEKPRLPRFNDIRAVVFDLYGTLFMSGTGDISLAENEDRSVAMSESLTQAGVLEIPVQFPLAEAFHAVIKKTQGTRAAEGIPYPEVEIREVWQEFLAALASAGARCPDLDKRAVSRLAIDYECRVNPVWPMPGLAPTLAALRQRNVHMGIVSNAQFYTKIMFPAFLGASLAELGFALDCCVYSYQEREGKPSTALYKKLKNALASHGILPPQTLYVGNDLRNDIWPAAEVGFKTVLFAGDQRSLRMRQDDPQLQSVAPDAVVTELWQLTTLVGQPAAEPFR